MNKCLQVNHCAYLTKTTGILDNNAASFLITVLSEKYVNTITVFESFVIYFSIIVQLINKKRKKPQYCLY